MNGSSKPKSRFYLHLVFLDYPSIIYVLLLFFTGFTWSKLLVLVLVLLVCGAHTWQVVVTFFYNLVVYFQLFFFFYFLQFRHCTFERCSLDEFAPSLIEHLLEERFGINITKMPLGYVCVVKRKKGATGQPYPAAMTMFHLETLPWYIMVTDRAEDFSPYQRFLFLHEVGHSTVYRKISIERKISSPIQALLLFDRHHHDHRT